MKADIHISEMKSKFLANISHEFRTPLSLISMPLEKMIKESEDEGLKQQLIGVNKNAENLLVLVNELLDFKNIETENEQLNISKVDITYLINEVCSEFVPLALSKNIKIINDTAMNPVFVFADNNKIGKCVANLISNAIKFTPENGEIKVLLNSEITDENRTISIEVEDNGIGIPQNEISKIFERFYRVDNGMNQPGNGIGLHIY